MALRYVVQHRRSGKVHTFDNPIALAGFFWGRNQRHFDLKIEPIR